MYELQVADPDGYTVRLHAQEDYDAMTAPDDMASTMLRNEVLVQGFRV